MINIDKKFLSKFFLFLLGMVISNIGVATTIRSSIGTSPIVAPAVAFTEIFSVNIIITTFVLNVIFVLCQITILKKRFKLIQLSQILVALLTGLFMGLGMLLTQFIHASSLFWINVLLNLVGNFILGLGFAIEIIADFTFMPGDGLVNLIFKETKQSCGKIKVCFDIILSIITIIMCWFGLHEIFGDCIGIGSIISALTVGLFTNFFLKLFKYQKSDI